MSNATPENPPLPAANLKSEIRNPKSETASPSARAWRRFRRNQPAVVSLVFLALLVAVVVLGPFVMAHAPNVTSDAQLQSPDARHWFQPIEE